MADPKQDNLQQNPNSQEDNIQSSDQVNPQPGGEDQQHVEGQPPLAQPVEEGAVGGLDVADLPSQQETGETVEEGLYAVPLPKDQRPTPTQVLEEDPSVEEEEIAPPLPPRGDVAELQGAVEEDPLYAVPLPKGQRPAPTQVLEEDPSVEEEEEIAPPLPPRNNVGEVEPQEDPIYQGIPGHQEEMEEDPYASLDQVSQGAGADGIQENPVPQEAGEELEEDIYQDPADFQGLGQGGQQLDQAGYQGPSIGDRQLVNGPYGFNDGSYAMEFDDVMWEGVRDAVIHDEEIDPKFLVTDGLMRHICDKIVQSEGNLPEPDLEEIVSILKNDKEGISELINEPVQVDIPNNPVREGRNVMTLLHLAYAYNVDPRIINAIESVENSFGESGLDGYNIQDADGNLPLHHAAKNCNGQVLDNCISKTNSNIINIRNFGNQSPLHVMVQNPGCSIGNIQVANECGMDFNLIDHPTGRMPIHYAAEAASSEVLSYVIRNTKAESPQASAVNTQDVNGRTPLHCAAISGNSKGLSVMLLQNGVDCAVRDKNYSTPLHYAVAGNDIKSIKNLCSVKGRVQGVKSSAASLLCEDLQGDTPLHIACKVEGTKAFETVRQSIKKHHGKQVLQELLIREGSGPRLNVSGFGSQSILSGVSGDLYGYLNSQNFPTSPVHAAVKANNLQLLNLFLKKSPDILRQSSPNGFNPVHMAALFADVKTVKLIIENASGEEVNAQSDSTLTPLHLACIRGDGSIIKRMVEHESVNVNQTMGPDQNTVLQYAINRGNHSLIKRLLSHPSIDLNVRNADGKTSAHSAMEKGDLKTVKALCNAGADVNTVDNNGRSVISSAIYSGQNEKKLVPIVKLLLNSGAKIGQSEDKNILLQKCINSGYNKLLDLLLEQGERINVEGKASPLVSAVVSGNTHAVKKLVASGGDINQKVSDENSIHYKNSLLMIAVENTDLVMLELLSSKGCNATAVGRDGNTACHMLVNHADKGFSEKGVKTLISKGGRTARDILSKQNSNGDTPLHLALKLSGTKIASAMISALDKKDFSKIAGAKNDAGETLLHVAVNSGNPDLVKLLVSNLNKDVLEALACTPNNNGDTPLHCALKNYDGKCARIILEGCDKRDLSAVIGVQNLYGNTALHLALRPGAEGLQTIQQGLNEVVDLMLNGLDKESLSSTVNVRNDEGKTPVHYAVSGDSTYSKKLIKACSCDTLTIPSLDGKLLSGCVEGESHLKKPKTILDKVLGRSVYKTLLKYEAKAAVRGLHGPDFSSPKSLQEGIQSGKFQGVSSSSESLSEKEIQSEQVQGSSPFQEFIPSVPVYKTLDGVEEGVDSSKSQKSVLHKLPSYSPELNTITMSPTVSLGASAKESGFETDTVSVSSSVDEVSSLSSSGLSSLSSRGLSSSSESLFLSGIFDKGEGQHKASEEQLQELSEEITDIVQGLPPITSEDIGAQAVSPSTSQGADVKKSSCQSK
ncbi:ankyrin repeat domain-containing protein [Ehrlichia chaffeensis]|uniref:ankyrin repeat domain-containing protein n=1 Tax=Ehrlichia chaffeensis TaxID=945 RepID=UPI000444EC6C|nr:ankyrin repeat domain-containing protein [Ehrlichia chaffeensis]AHX10778.1 ankyrin repeat family protein [Ehrlichia chaffeensis str. West Paces]